MGADIIGANVPEAYAEAIWFLRIHGDKESSRNGEVISAGRPVEMKIRLPVERVLFDPIRDANPFFHAMEFVWLMSGEMNAMWIAQFNKGMLNYSDDKITLPASYGYRWATHWGFNQVHAVVEHLIADPESRRAVIAMWDPGEDLSVHPRVGADKPCNTHIYFRIIKDKLDMTVLNRSNDAIWGMLGANAVHMTMLQELIARAIGIGIGNYRAYTNNLHIYKSIPRFEQIMATTAPVDYYAKLGLVPTPLLKKGETLDQFISDCHDMVRVGPLVNFRTRWMQEVGSHICMGYLDKENRHKWIERIMAEDWKMACYEWVIRREKRSDSVRP